jgi:uncharacterized protein YegL
MGWASYREDIVSRYAGATRTATSRKAPAGSSRKPAAKGGRTTKDPEMSKFKEFTVSSPRPLPVILLADVSGSMATDGKIDALNAAVTEMLAAFAEEEDGRTEIHVAVVTFGGKASLHVAPKPAKDVQWTPMLANGCTPLGAALDIVTNLIEDREKIPARAYRPTIVLVSDGLPNDEWQGPLARLLGSERAQKAQRFALGIGAEADHDMLRAFLDNPEGRVFQAHEAREIRKFFRWVTMSVTSRSRSVKPNQAVEIDPLGLDDYGDF